MPPLPGVLAMLPPSQLSPKSLSSTASTTTTTVTTEVAGSGFISETTTAVTTTTAITTATATTTTATKKCSSSVATTSISTNSVKTTDSAKKASPSSSESKSSTASCSSASSSSNVEDAVTDVNKKCDNNDSEKTESSNDDTDLDTSSNIFGRPQKILLKHVNAHITCNLCKGYLIDATTIVECLHSFCHSCIMNHLRKDRKDQYCPRCEMMINTAKPNNIKSDTTLQAIVYKLVPGLYEKELLRKRAFYCTRTKEAMLATPEQRGEDTEHLIFGPTENMSLSLEYADIDEIPTCDTFELNKPKYLQCPAIFTVAHIKKFVFGKFGIDQNRFTIEIMYKVKTIVLADHYKIMDVAYIYTWKRDAPMRFFFRVKEIESALRKKKEMKVTRPSEETGESSSAIKNESDTGTKDETKIEVKDEEAEAPEVKNEEVPVPVDAVENVPVKDEAETEKKKSIPDTTQQIKSSSDKPSPDPRTEKLKITLVNKGKSSSKDEESSKSKSNSKTGKASKHHTPTEQDDRKVENIKLKIDLSKQGSVTIINMSSPDANKKEVKPIKPEKEWKIKVKKDKDLKIGGSTEKTKSSSEEKLVPPITIELDKPSTSPKSPEMSISEKEEEEKKSEFLNSIALAPIKSLHSPDKLEKQKFLSSLSATLPPSNFSTKKFSMAPPPVPPTPKLSAAAKRKNKEPVKNVAKKPKLELPKPTPPHPQIKVRSNLLADPKPDPSSLSFKLAPFPIGASSAPSVPIEISKKQEDEKLMPAPPPLKMLEIFKKNGLKAPKLSKSKPPNKPAKTTSDGFLRPMVTTSLTSSKVPIVSNVMGNRTPVARRYPPILPKSSRINPFANIPTDMNKFLPGPTTEIKPIQNGENKEIKVYGPPTTASSNQKPNIPSPSTSACTSAPSTQQQNGSTTPRHSSKNSTSTNYLNYAIFNASKTKMSDVPLGCRTPIYTPNSPIYSPNSPQYMPNYNIPVQPTYKYTKTQTNVGSYLQNVFGPNKQMSNLFPAPPTKTPSESQSANNNNKSEGDENSLKRTKSPSEKNSPEPTDKQTPVQSLLNSCNINIPSSLSITITNENGDSNSNNSSNPKHNNPVNNYIEILKLPDSPSVPSEHSNSILSSPDHKNSNQSSKQNNSKAGFTVNLPKSSPSAVTTPTSHTKPPPSPSSSTTSHCIPAAPDNIDKKPSTPLPQKAKKTPSPEKKIVEKPPKKAQAEKRPAADSTKTSKDKTEISPTPTKKYRPILPRAKSPPTIAAAPTVTTPSSKTNPKLTAQSTNTKKASQKTIPSTNNKSPMPSPSSSNLTKKPESVVDLTTAQKTTPPSTSPVPSNSIAQAMSTTNMQPDLSPFLQQLQQAQSPGSPNGNIFLPHLAAAASFNPAGYPVTFGYNLQRAYLMEQLTRMQKAGTEALEKYMQRLKNNNTSLAKSPTGSPGSTTPTDSGSDVKNSV